MKILIVEDDSVSQKIVDTILTKNGYETLLASSVKEGIKHLKSTRQISVVILDIMMPDEDGYSLLRYINENQGKVKVPVIMCSTVGDESAVLQSAALGALDYIRKPIESKLLLSKVKNVLNKRNKTVLVVDDEKMIRDLLKNTLERDRIEVLVADSGKSALELVESNNVNVIISDIQMDEMSGLDLLVQIKMRYPEIPVIMITGHGRKYDKDAVISAGADGYITKPFNNLEILRIVNDLLTKNYTH